MGRGYMSSIDDYISTFTGTPIAVDIFYVRPNQTMLNGSFVSGVNYGTVQIVRVKGNSVTDPRHLSTATTTTIVDIDDSIIVVTCIHNHPQRQLLLIIQAACHISLHLCFCQCRQKHCGKDGDDGNDHQQFNQGKTPPALTYSLFAHVF